MGVRGNALAASRLPPCGACSDGALIQNWLACVLRHAEDLFEGGESLPWRAAEQTRYERRDRPGRTGLEAAGFCPRFLPRPGFARMVLGVHSICQFLGKGAP